MHSYRHIERHSRLLTKQLPATALVFSACVVGLAATAPTARTATVSSCDSAIAALNKQLPMIAKRKIGVRVASATGSRAKTAKAKKRYSASRKSANQIRLQIKQFCSNGSIQAQHALCSKSIDTYAISLNLLATRKYEYKKVKGKGARAVKRKRALKTKIKKLGSEVKKQSQTFKTACAQSPPKAATPLSGTTGTAATGTDFEDPTTTASCTPAQFHHSLGCFAGAPAISIPSHPDGLNADYQVNITGQAAGICSISGLQPNYKLMIIVDGTPVASATGGGLIQANCSPTIDLNTQISALTLSPTSAHRIVLNLHTDILLPQTPKIDAATMTVDIAQL